MPIGYKRKSTSPRRVRWTMEQLLLSAEAVKTRNMGVRKVSKNLTYRFLHWEGDWKMVTTVPKSCLFGIEDKNKVKTQIKKMQEFGFQNFQNSEDYTTALWSKMTKLNVSRRKRVSKKIVQNTYMISGNTSFL